MRQASHRRYLRLMPAGLLTAALLLAPLWILPVRQMIFISQMHAIRQITHNHDNHDNYDNYDNHDNHDNHNNHDNQSIDNTPNHPTPSPLVKFTFTASQYRRLHFERDGREFYYRGMMYDISSVEESNGKVTVYALPDEKETRLLAAFNAGGKHQPANPFHNPRIGFLAYYPLKTVDPLPEACSCRIELFIKSSPVIPDPFILIFSPPPELLS